MNETANSLQAFLAMGGYGFYVWGSFGLVAATVAGELIALRARRRALHRRIDAHDLEAAA